MASIIGLILGGGLPYPAAFLVNKVKEKTNDDFGRRFNSLF
jgi:hypothetical protein